MEECRHRPVRRLSSREKNRAELRPGIEPASAAEQAAIEGAGGINDDRANHRACRGAGDHGIPAHLLLRTPHSVPALTGWPDQGQFTDVMVHLGTLLAILIYFWRDVIAIAQGRSCSCSSGEVTAEGSWRSTSRSAPSPPSSSAHAREAEHARPRTKRRGRRLEHHHLRHPHADRRHVGRPENNDHGRHDAKSAFIIGVAQALALIPGTSRSGVTMTAGALSGLHAPRCARFSFLLGIPAIAAAGVLTLGRRAYKADVTSLIDELLATRRPSSPEFSRSLSR